MWCDNCLLIFPLRAGAMILGTFMAIYQIVGALLLFLYGDFFFFHKYEASIYGGYALLQGLVGLLAVLGFGRRSTLMTRVLVRTYVVIIILGAIRGSLMAWSLFYGQDHIRWECDHGGKRWIDPSTLDPNMPQPIETRLMPETFCYVGLRTAAGYFAFFLALDFVLMCYFYFLIWRYNVRLYNNWCEGTYYP
ncbi:hypothetical protein C2G38_2077688 [Gigaspora rosea]|uniref:Uncharacterized protein n=1 Tax=Gigaspora rosea TaxID=44941 RepID=A0A397VKX0_9GLOM|nr:hypothetical protein C2G38_2077688 [Gigaspora rosea]